jgi:CBS domain-containing protein
VEPAKKQGEIEAELPELSEKDLEEALREIGGYIDITPADLKKIYTIAFKHARERLLGPKARDIMTTPVVTTTPEATLEKAADLLASHHISGMPVLENNQVTGIITETDIVKALTGKQRPALFDLLHAGKKPARVKDVMTTPAITITPDTSVLEIAELFTRKKINRAPVVERGALLGIVTRADLVKAYQKL